MNPSNFIETLSCIGYPKADKLDPAALEWAFEHEATKSFLAWFCTSVEKDNVVSTDEIDKYKAIEDSGEVLNGAQLEEALCVLRLDKTESETESILESDVKHLRESLERAQAQKKILKARCNKLSNHHMSLRSKIAKLEEVEKNEAKANQKMIDTCSFVNRKIANVLHSLAESVQKIISLYNVHSPRQGEGQATECGPFLSQCDLKAFYEAEEWFARDLTTFIKKQFFEGIADMAGERDKDNYVLVDMSSPEKGPLKNDASFLENCQEFSRLQQIFPKSECNRINAWINASKALTAVNEARSILNTLKSNQFPTSPTEISRLHHMVEQDIESAKAQTSSLVSSVPDLIRELGGLQGTEVLTGDYDLKLQRQDYFIRKQDEVIGQLVSQRARNEFVIMLYELESRYHKETHYLLSAARKLLEENLQAWQQRMKALDDPDLSVKKLERNVVDTRDKSSARLFHLLGDSPDDDRMLFLPKQKVVEKAKKLNSLYNRAKASDQTADEKHLTKVSELKSCVKDSMSALYAGSSTSAGHPPLIPPVIQSAMTSLTSMIGKLETDLSHIVTDVNNKKMKLKNNLLLGKERELYVLFHTNPTRLQYVVNGLADRLKAQNIK